MTDSLCEHAARPRLLDLFCCEGGAGTGYARAGFDVIGIDREPQPRYPFAFVQADAIDYLQRWAALKRWAALSDDEKRLGWPLDAIHASPPCQAYTTMNNRHGSASLPLIDKVRDLLDATGLPYVIENVAGARAELRDPVRLTGEMFGLRVHRPRLFETNWPLMAMTAPSRQDDPVAVYGKNDQRRLWTRTDGTELHAATLEEAREAMGMPWATWRGCCEAVPPAYTEWIGAQLFPLVRRSVAA